MVKSVHASRSKILSELTIRLIDTRLSNCQDYMKGQPYIDFSEIMDKLGILSLYERLAVYGGDAQSAMEAAAYES